MWEQSTFWPEEHLASLSPSPVSERDWMTRVATSPSSLLGLLIDSGPYGWCGRTSPASCRSTKDGRLEPSSGCWSNCGYGIAYRVLDAQYFGVPQRRRRVFVVGHAGDWRAAAAVLLERSSLSGYPPPRREARKDVAPTLSARAHGGGGPGSHFDIDGGLIPSTDDLSHCLNAGGMGRQDFETETLIAHSLSADGFDASEDGTGRGVPMIPIAISTAHTKSNGSGFSDDIAHTLESGGAQAVAFAQNSRDEVRLHGGDRQDGRSRWQRRRERNSSLCRLLRERPRRRRGRRSRPPCAAWGMTHSHPNGGGQIAIAFTQNQDGDVLSGDVHAIARHQR